MILCICVCQFLSMYGHVCVYIYAHLCLCKCAQNRLWKCLWCQLWCVIKHRCFTWNPQCLSSMFCCCVHTEKFLPLNSFNNSGLCLIYQTYTHIKLVVCQGRQMQAGYFPTTTCHSKKNACAVWWNLLIIHKCDLYIFVWLLYMLNCFIACTVRVRKSACTHKDLYRCVNQK